MKDQFDNYTRDAFDGATYEPRRDFVRLNGQLLRVKNLMADGRWRTLPEIRNHVGGSEAAISARLRDLRKERYGLHTVERKSLGDGLHSYRLILNQQRAA